MKSLKSGRARTYSRPLASKSGGAFAPLPYSLFHPWLYVTEVMVHFRYYKKWKHFSFAWCRPGIDLSQTDTGTTNGITDLCQVSSRSVGIWENDGRKACFQLAIEDSHAYCAWPSILQTITRPLIESLIRSINC